MLAFGGIVYGLSSFGEAASAAGEHGMSPWIPLGVGLTRTTVFNRRPMNIGVNYYYNVERPDGGPGQQLRFVVALLFPR